jgi:integrin alpha FG-GAP repeat containing protein 1
MKLLAPVFVLLFLLSWFSAFTKGDFFHDFLNPRLRHAPHFQGSQLYKVDIGFSGLEGTIGCFGDFNSDKFTDVFIISQNRSEIHLYLWNTDVWKFQSSSKVNIQSLSNITNIAAGDFNYDGMLDLLVMGNHYKDINGTMRTATYLKLFHGDRSTLTLSDKTIPDANDQVIILDYNNDLRLDLFGETAEDPPRRAFWVNNDNGGFDIVHQGGDLAPLAKPHSNGFADFNGDCLADMFVTSVVGGVKQYEIWINRKNTYQLRDVTPLPSGTGQITFADFDGDGTMDLCVPICDPPETCANENSLRIVYNKQKPLCPLLNSKKIDCRKATNLCSADDSFSFTNVSLPITHSDTLVVDGVSSELFTGTRFAFDDLAGRPLTIRPGDYNLDGYPDLAIPVRDLETNATMVQLWTNVPDGSRRKFQLQSEGTTELKSITDAYASAFVDLDEDGNLDLLVLRENAPYVQAIFNNFQNDAYFLKAVGLNGVCTAWCTNGKKFPDPKPYGVNFPGGTFKFTITDLSGATHLAIATQLSQSAYMSFNTPYVLFGLGRTSNYIEQFFYGVPINQEKHFAFWTGSTIPNSQVVAIPYKPTEPAGWTLELYTNPSGVMFWVIIAVLVALVLLGGAIYYFHRKEKMEDEKHKQEVAHLFSFDAL